jgi:hypothetical protein
MSLLGQIALVVAPEFAKLITWLFRRFVVRKPRRVTRRRTWRARFRFTSWLLLVGLLTASPHTAVATAGVPSRAAERFCEILDEAWHGARRRSPAWELPHNPEAVESWISREGKVDWAQVARLSLDTKAVRSRAGVLSEGRLRVAVRRFISLAEVRKKRSPGAFVFDTEDYVAHLKLMALEDAARETAPRLVVGRRAELEDAVATAEQAPPWAAYRTYGTGLKRVSEKETAALAVQYINENFRGSAAEFVYLAVKDFAERNLPESARRFDGGYATEQTVDAIGREQVNAILRDTLARCNQSAGVEMPAQVHSALEGDAGLVVSYLVAQEHFVKSAIEKTDYRIRGRSVAAWKADIELAGTGTAINGLAIHELNEFEVAFADFHATYEETFGMLMPAFEKMTPVQQAGAAGWFAVNVLKDNSPGTIEDIAIRLEACDAALDYIAEHAEDPSFHVARARGIDRLNKNIEIMRKSGAMIVIGAVGGAAAIALPGGEE